MDSQETNPEHAPPPGAGLLDQPHLDDALPPGSGRQWRTRVGVAAMALIALAMGLIAVVSFGARGTLVALIVSTVPVPLMVFLVVSRDRHEPEPPRMLALAFGWGATIAAFFSGVLNTIGFVAVESFSADPEVGGVFVGSVSAPVVEEALKGAVLFLIVRRRRNELNGLVDGVVYAAMVGLGFAVAENVGYYARALDEGYLGPVIIVRGIFSPFAHPLFTSLTGIGVALGLGRRVHRWLPPVLGLAAAMTMHSLWNTTAFFGPAFLFVYAGVFAPVFFVVLAVLRRAAAKEGDLIRRHLQPEVDAGALSADEADALGSIPARRQAVRMAAVDQGDVGRQAARGFQNAAVQLALARYRGEQDDPSRWASVLSRWQSELAQFRALRLPALVPPSMPGGVSGPPMLVATLVQPDQLGPEWHRIGERSGLPLPSGASLEVAHLALVQAAYGRAGPGGWNSRLTSTNLAYAPGMPSHALDAWHRAVRRMPAYQEDWFGVRWHTTVTVESFVGGVSLALGLLHREPASGVTYEALVWAGAGRDVLGVLHLVATPRLDRDARLVIRTLSPQLAARLGAVASREY